MRRQPRLRSNRDSPRLRHDLFPSLGQTAGMVLACMALIAGVVQILRLQEARWGLVFSDPASQYGFSPLAGLFTYLGVVALVSAGAICLFVRTLVIVTSRDRAILGLVGLLSALLAADDLFVLHEGVVRDLLGWNEMVFFAIYGVMGLGVLGLVGPQVLGRRFLALWLSIAFLALMTSVDYLETIVGTPAIILLSEETAKFCGFVLWAAFWMCYARAAVQDDRDAV